jgi:hypothetical protein
MFLRKFVDFQRTTRRLIPEEKRCEYLGFYLILSIIVLLYKNVVSSFLPFCLCHGCQWVIDDMTCEVITLTGFLLMAVITGVKHKTIYLLFTVLIAKQRQCILQSGFNDRLGKKFIKVASKKLM